MREGHDAAAGAGLARWLRAFVARVPLLGRAVWQPGSVRGVFAHIHARRRWGDAESVSGPGSSMAQTANVRAALPRLIREFGCDSLLDVPCGDFHWMRTVELGVPYIGGDIVARLVRGNQREYARADRRFVVLDITSDAIPRADLILCRDCLVHLSHADVVAALENFRRSGAKYLLTTTFVDRQANEDIATGLWRPLNLQRAPFDLPAPLALIDEACPEPAYRDKHLGLWRLSDLSGRRPG